MLPLALAAAAALPRLFAGGMSKAARSAVLSGFVVAILIQAGRLGGFWAEIERMGEIPTEPNAATAARLADWLLEVEPGSVFMCSPYGHFPLAYLTAGRIDVSVFMDSPESSWPQTLGRLRETLRSGRRAVTGGNEKARYNHAQPK